MSPCWKTRTGTPNPWRFGSSAVAGVWGAREGGAGKGITIGDCAGCGRASGLGALVSDAEGLTPSLPAHEGRVPDLRMQRDARELLHQLGVFFRELDAIPLEPPHERLLVLRHISGEVSALVHPGELRVRDAYESLPVELRDAAVPVRPLLVPFGRARVLRVVLGLQVAQEVRGQGGTFPPSGPEDGTGGQPRACGSGTAHLVPPPPMNLPCAPSHLEELAVRGELPGDRHQLSRAPPGAHPLEDTPVLFHPASEQVEVHAVPAHLREVVAADVEGEVFGMDPDHASDLQGLGESGDLFRIQRLDVGLAEDGALQGDPDGLAPLDLLDVADDAVARVHEEALGRKEVHGEFSCNCGRWDAGR